MGPTQDLQQKVCQKFGWSLVLSKTTEETWQAEIVMGLGEKRKFVTSESFGEDKDGKAAVSTLVLTELASEIAARESLPTQELVQVFQTIIRQMQLLDSNDPSTWTRFWNNPPEVVGIDTEGNSICPPVLVQIATEDYVILETPATCLSEDLERLLRDDSITKVFCDNFAHKDKKSLGLEIEQENTYTIPPIVDLESLAMDCLGPVKTARGLGRMVALTMPELKVRIEKPKTTKGNVKGRFANISRFALIEQGKAKPLRGLGDLKRHEQQYAALDAWCTLQVYRRMQEYYLKANSNI